MTTSVEDILIDILNFLKNFIGHFLPFLQNPTKS